MAKPHERVFALVAAALFLGTSIAFSLAVIWQIRKDNKTKDTTQSQTDTAKTQEGKLEGTKMQGFTPVATVDKLQKIDLKEGTGEVVKAGATVKAHYTGAVASDGKIFQSSHDMPGDQPIEFSLNGVIKGWTEGVPGMKVGGTRRLIIPAEMAYGATPPQGSNIPPNAALVFDIELAGVQQ